MSGDMLDTYVEYDERVNGGELDAAYGRWDFGALMLRERETNGGNQLPKGRMRQLMERTERSRQELQFRAQFAEQYERNEVANALATFGSWYEIVKNFSSNGNYGKNAAGEHEGAELSEGDAEGDGWQLLLGTFQDRLEAIPDSAVDAVVTDPPYPAEYLDEWWSLGELVPRVLRKGGVLLARCGHLLIHEYMDALAVGGLNFGWIYSEPLPGSNVRFRGRKIAVSWQPWLAFVNGDWPSGSIEWHPDTLTESPRVKERYVWEQKWTVAAELTAQFASQDSLVLDPFAGSAAYGEAALSVGCNWIGIEKDAAGHHDAAERLRELR